jgi:hypothetical protein
MLFDINSLWDDDLLAIFDATLALPEVHRPPVRGRSRFCRASLLYGRWLTSRRRQQACSPGDMKCVRHGQLTLMNTGGGQSSLGF